MPSGTRSPLRLPVVALLAAVALVLPGASAAGVPAAAGAAPPPRAAAPRAASTPSAAPRPDITVKLIPFGAQRKAQTAAYNKRHYHQDTWKLTDPKVVVLHHTSGAEWESAWNTFANNTAYETIPGHPEKPGVSAHFIVDKDGTIYQCLPLTLRGRHAIGMNWTAIGIEIVQEDIPGKSGHYLDRQILKRPKQMAAALALVRYLQDRFGIKKANVVGHATANDSPYFKDYTGVKNGAGDWFAPEVKAFKARL